MKRILSFAAILLISLALLMGCSDKDGKREPLTVVDGGACSYKIVRSAKASEAVVQSALTIRQALQDNYNTDIELKDDWLNEKKGEAPSEYEILVGVSNREETAIDGLLAHDYVVRAVGSKIIIVGGSDEATVEGVKYFAETVCAPSDSGTLLFGEEHEKEYKHDYPLKSLSIAGVDIGEYKIVYDSSSAYGQERAETVRKTLRNSCGISPEVISDKESGGEYEILVGNTSRSQSSAVVDSYARPNVYYTFAVKDTKLLIAFEGVRCGETAVKEFDTLICEQNGRLDLNSENTDYTSDIISEINGSRSEGTAVRAMTSNVLAHQYQSADDPYLKRMEILADTYLTYLPDVIGLQECREADYEALLPLIEKYYGVVQSAKAIQNPVPDDKTIDFECTKILYRKDKYKYYDAEYEKLVFDFRGKTLAQNMKTISSAVFENKESGEKFVFVNSHFVSSYGDEKTDGHKQIRVENANQFANKIARLRAEHQGLPIITTGDYFSPKNTASNDYPAYDIIMGAGLADTSVEAKKKMSPGMGTSHNMGTSVASTNIDLVLADTASCEILLHRIVTNIYTKDASDHFPVYADIGFKS